MTVCIPKLFKPLPQNPRLAMSTNHNLLHSSPYAVLTKHLRRKSCLKPGCDSSITVPVLLSPCQTALMRHAVQHLSPLPEAKRSSALSYHRWLWCHFVEPAFDPSVVQRAPRDMWNKERGNADMHRWPGELNYR